MDTLTEALATVKRTVTSRRRSESFDVSFTFTLTPVLKPKVGEPTNTVKQLHVSPEMIEQDMKSWNPEQWTRHLQEKVKIYC